MVLLEVLLTLSSTKHWNSSEMWPLWLTQNEYLDYLFSFFLFLIILSILFFPLPVVFYLITPFLDICYALQDLHNNPICMDMTQNSWIRYFLYIMINPLHFLPFKFTKLPLVIPSINSYSSILPFYIDLEPLIRMDSSKTWFPPRHLSQFHIPPEFYFPFPVSRPG